MPKPEWRRARNREYDAARRTDKPLRMNFDLPKALANIERRVIPEPNSGCFIWLGATTPKGYGLLRVGGQNGKALYVHRLVYEGASGGPIAEGMVIRHSCDNPSCCNPDHLSVGYPKDNTEDMVERDRHCRGERSPSAKLTDDDVRSIRKDPRSLSRVAKDYGVDIKQIHRVKRRENWKHVE